MLKKKGNSRFDSLIFKKNIALSKRSQVTIFIIVAVIIVALIGGYFLLKGKLVISGIPASLKPVEDHYLACIEENTKFAVNMLGEGGGYIYNPPFEPGSDFSPFSNELDLQGMAIPYWYYVSGNNLVKEQVPSRADMEKQIEKYLEENFACDFSSFVEQGFSLNFGNIKADVSIFDNKVRANINSDLDVSFGNQSARISKHQQDVQTNIGKLYNAAVKLYNEEKQNSFLENYSLDVLYLYAPVEGVKVTCSPVIWNPYEVFDNLTSALEANIQAIKIKGNYYQNANDYFVYDAKDILSNEKVSFIYDKNWASRFEVWPTKNNMMMAEPVGLQEGLGIMGFCYVPYKFVYDMYFPVVARVYDSNEAFQFPVAVVISKNMPREAVPGESVENAERICDKANSDLTIYTYNVNLDPVEANVEFKCLNDVCSLGKTKVGNNGAILETKVPQCVNGILVVKGGGYKEKDYIISTNEENVADIILDKEYNLTLEVYVDGSLTENMAILSISENFGDSSAKFLNSIAYPTNPNLKISEGAYKFELKVYKQNSIILPSTNKQQCVKIPRAGLLGVLGMTDEKCFNIEIPSQTISNVLYAGGYANYYITLSQLENAGKIKIYAISVKIPSSIEEIPDVYDSIENKKLNIEIA